MNKHVVSSGVILWEASTHLDGFDSTQSLDMRRRACIRCV
ncbi:hypothetical protein ALP98_101531 [Pseudomonas viridiflava]|uniref:Uncharacterized protein n=3 Tax=Pseudomonas syringae group TaxID=136849 RepID=A0A3M4NUW9_PSEVI|nr:hypothetical protein ALQ30_101141 [Pseudomonas syringae pv. persicae]RMQ08627.1 hypothetical protein ALQ09_101040 [Pseudomonas viridiflava]RMQ69785.1 hypothetical protein ALP98_101531 [Pseudomonas viridiflava]RMR54921.1 hypothetical protein ALP83_100937 [Pseudomonas syringae pv. actinidiae]